MSPRTWAALALLILFIPEAWGGQGARRSQGRREVEFRYVGMQTATNNASTYNFTFNLPAPSEGRRIVVMLTGLKSGTNVNVSSLVLNSVSATMLFEVNLPMAVYTFNEATLSGNHTFTVNYTNILDRSVMAVWEVYGWGGVDVTDEDFTVLSANKTYNLTNLPKGSKILTSGYNGAVNAFTWTGATEVFDVAVEASDQASAGITDVTATGNYSVTIVSTGGATTGIMVFRSE